MLLVSLSGCGASPDSLMKEQIKNMNDMAEALEKNEPASKLNEIKKRGEETNKKMDKLKLSDQDKKKIVEKYKDEITQARTRLEKAMMKRAIEGMGEGFPKLPKMGEGP